MASRKKLEVVAALIEDDLKVLLCQRRKEDAFGLLWEFPGGVVEDKETKEEALRREIKEELNIDIKVGSLIEVFSDKIPSLEIRVFLYKVLSFRGNLKPLECKDLGFFSFVQARKLDLAPVDRKILDYLQEK